MVVAAKAAQREAVARAAGGPRTPQARRAIHPAVAGGITRLVDNTAETIMGA